MDHAIETPVPETVIEANPELEVRSALQQYKAKKWALQIVHRFLVRYGSSSFAEIPTMKNDPGQLLGRYFIQNWAVKFMNRFVNILRAKKNNSVWISERMENLILQYLTQSLELSLTYKELKPNVEFILYEVCFPLLCYNQADVEKWELDPTELIRSQGIVLPGGLRGCGRNISRTTSLNLMCDVQNFYFVHFMCEKRFTHS